MRSTAACGRPSWCPRSGGQITVLAIPLTAAVLLNASPTQMGLLQALEVLPFALFALPTGVLLDRVRKLPVFIGGEGAVAGRDWVGAAGGLARRAGHAWLYVVGFVIGIVNTTAGGAGQIVLTQIVPRERLVEAHAKNALASSGAEVAGPRAGGPVDQAAGRAAGAGGGCADAVGVHHHPARHPCHGDAARGCTAPFWDELKEGLHFVRERRLLVSMAFVVAGWHLFQRRAGGADPGGHARAALGAADRGLVPVAVGVGTVLASSLGHRISRWMGPGPCLVLGFGICGVGWSLLALAPAGATRGALLCRDAVYLGRGCGADVHQLPLAAPVGHAGADARRMTSTMRWLILLPAAPGACWGWLGSTWACARRWPLPAWAR